MQRTSSAASGSGTGRGRGNTCGEMRVMRTGGRVPYVIRFVVVGVGGLGMRLAGTGPSGGERPPGELPGAAVHHHSLGRLNAINASLKKRPSLYVGMRIDHHLWFYIHRSKGTSTMAKTQRGIATGPPRVGHRPAIHAEVW